jgi:hypothetical protein
MLIHIGYHKTGTSFLQRYMFFRHPPSEFFAPWTVRSGEAVQHFILTNPARFDAAAIREEFQSSISKDKKNLVPVISQQDFCGNPIYGRYYGFEVADRLHKAFPAAKILITIREQKSILRSLYGQYIRQDGEWPIETFLGTGKEPPGFAPICRLDHFEYDLLVEYYVQQFGSNQVLVLPYEMLSDNPIEFQQAIHDFAGTGATASGEFERELPGFGAYSLKVMRRLNKVIRQPPDWNGDWSRNPVLFRAKIKVCQTIDAILPRSWHRPEHARLTDFIEKRTTGYYRASNARLQNLTKYDLASYGYEI